MVGRERSHSGKVKVTLQQKTTGKTAQANNKMRATAQLQIHSSIPFLNPQHYPTEWANPVHQSREKWAMEVADLTARSRGQTRHKSQAVHGKELYPLCLPCPCVLEITAWSGMPTSASPATQHHPLFSMVTKLHHSDLPSFSWLTIEWNALPLPLCPAGFSHHSDLTLLLLFVLLFL